MTIDKAKLKALAEAATPGTWERSDGNEVSVSHDGDEAFWCWEEAGPAQVHGGGAQAVADADFIAAANPAAVLALLAELDSAQKHWQNDSNNVQALTNEVVRLTAERDQLKADNEALQRNFEVLLEAATQMLSFAHPTCMNDEKWRDRVAGFAAGDRYD